MTCPNCGHTMNHHANKLLLDDYKSSGEAGSKVIVAYSCPHCGTNASKTVDSD